MKNAHLESKTLPSSSLPIYRMLTFWPAFTAGPFPVLASTYARPEGKSVRLLAFLERPSAAFGAASLVALGALTAGAAS